MKHPSRITAIISAVAAIGALASIASASTSIPALCVRDSDCIDDVPCTIDLCLDYRCHQTPAPGCCTTNADCVSESDACSVGNTCNVNSGLCVANAAYDADSDGAPCAQDCHDDDPAAFPGQLQFCDGVQRSCGASASLDFTPDCLTTTGYIYEYTEHDTVHVHDSELSVSEQGDYPALAFLYHASSPAGSCGISVAISTSESGLGPSGWVLQRLEIALANGSAVYLVDNCADGELTVSRAQQHITVAYVLRFGSDDDGGGGQQDPLMGYARFALDVSSSAVQTTRIEPIERGGGGGGGTTPARRVRHLALVSTAAEKTALVYARSLDAASDEVVVTWLHNGDGGAADYAYFGATASQAEAYDSLAAVIDPRDNTIAVVATKPYSNTVMYHNVTGRTAGWSMEAVESPALQADGANADALAQLHQHVGLALDANNRLVLSYVALAGGDVAEPRAYVGSAIQDFGVVTWSRMTLPASSAPAALPVNATCTLWSDVVTVSSRVSLAHGYDCSPPVHISDTRSSVYTYALPGTPDPTAPSYAAANWIAGAGAALTHESSGGGAGSTRVVRNKLARVVIDAPQSRVAYVRG